jgi:tetratricopeptide (TPR) repeat protein
VKCLARAAAGYPRRVSPRTRVRLLVGFAALAAAGIAVGATLVGRGEDGVGEVRPQKRQAPPLELGLVTRNDAEARSLRAAERDFDAGRKEAARERFESVLAANPGSLEAAVGAAIAAWPNGTVDKLTALARGHPDSALVRLNLGLALYAAGRDAAAANEWREAERRDPDTLSALRAESLLHPGMAPGRPFFYPSFGVPGEVARLPAGKQLDALRRRAAAGGLNARLLYGVALQRVGRPVSASEAFSRALAQNPDNLAAQVADAVGRFDKDDPSAAFSRLGPLTRSHPRSALLRFHLGLLLLWIRDVEDARKELQKAQAVDPRGLYGREASDLLSRLEAVGT